VTAPRPWVIGAASAAITVAAGLALRAVVPRPLLFLSAAAVFTAAELLLRRRLAPRDAPWPVSRTLVWAFVAAAVLTATLDVLEQE
jgi:hypothetical protein